MERTTQRDVARRAGVSQRLVSAVLHDNAPNIRVGTETRERIQRAAAELGYRPNVVARSLVTRKTHTIGFVVRNLANPVYGELTNRVHRAAAAHGFDIMIAVNEGVTEHPTHLIERLLGRCVDGLLIWADHGRMEYEALARWGSTGPPLVVMGIAVPDTRTSFVAVDRPVGVTEAVAHLVRLGHTQIGYVGSEARAGVPAPHATKFEGFLRGLAAHGLSPARVWSFDRFPWDVDHRPLWIALAEEMAREPDLPSAMIVGSDALALAMLAAFARAGIRVPDDVALIGYDDIPAAATSVPALTTLAQPTQELAEVAVDLLLELIREPGSGPLRRMLPPQLVVRGSCGAHATPPALPSTSTLLREEPVWTTKNANEAVLPPKFLLGSPSVP